MLTLELGRKLLDAAVAYAGSEKLARWLLSCWEADGSVRHVASQPEASPSRFAIARGKASGAIAMRMPSRKIGEMAVDRPPFFSSLPPLIEGGIVPAAGGVLFGNGDGNLLGAIGISGDTSDRDEAAALAAIAAAGLQVWPS